MKILLFCNFALPDSCADATRVMNFAKLLKRLGHKVELLGISYRKDESLSGTVDEIQYEMVRAKSFTGYKAPLRIFALEKDIKLFLQSNSLDVPYDVIFLSGVYFDFSGLFIEYSKKYATSLIVNSLEWYDKSNIQFVGLRGKVNFIKNRIALTHIHKKMGNILAISSLLNDYYLERGCNTVTIPTIIDISEYENVTRLISSDNCKTRIAYAGSPGRKDYILNAVRALQLLDDAECEKLELHFYGPELKELYSLGLSQEYLDTYKDNIICHGRIPYTEVKKKIAAADFTVLLRPNKRYANAGFPTKVGESMACGTPVIANITSDLGKYIIDGKTGIVCSDESPEACAEAFRRALKLSSEQKSEMRKNAFEMACTGFNYLSYVDVMQNFLEHLK